jgi:AhpD family alkylhydroperoxidase
MTREEAYRDINKKMGLVPSWLRRVPESSLGLEWQLLERVEMEPGPIPQKYRELIGLAVAAVTRCPYCTFWHTEMARLQGAEEAEIEDALQFAKSTTGWSNYIHGLQTDLGHFKEEVLEICEHLRSQQR